VNKLQTAWLYARAILIFLMCVLISLLAGTEIRRDFGDGLWPTVARFALSLYIGWISGYAIFSWFERVRTRAEIRRIRRIRRETLMSHYGRTSDK
jgi:ammonia channel protein AmtB